MTQQAAFSRIFSLPWRAMIFSLITAAVIAAAGYAFYSQQRVRLVRQRQSELNTIASLKAEQIAEWRRERIGDAVVLLGSRQFQRDASRWMTNQGDRETGKYVRTRMEALLVFDKYLSVMLTDRDGRVRLTLGRKQPAAIDQAALKQLQYAISERKVEFGNFYWSEQGQTVYLDMFVPLTADSPAVGAVILRIDPAQFLFPFIQSYPVPSKSSEILIVRRDGDSILFLNDLRFVQNMAMKLRRPLSDTLLPAAMAALGREGMVEGRDYRGVKVLAVIKKIPESPWFMVAKIDSDEVYAPARKVGAMFGFAVLALLALDGLATGLFWQRSQKELYRRLHRSELERKALVLHFDHIVKYANDIIFLTDDKYRIIEANDRTVQTYGYSREELYGMTIPKLLAPGARSSFKSQMQELKSKGGLIYETVHSRKDGSVFPAEISGRLIEVEGKEYLQGIVRDISERKACESSLQGINRELAAVRQCHRILIRATDEQRLFDGVCRIVVEDAGYRFAWIGLPEKDASKKLRTVSYYGHEAGFLKSAAFAWDDSELGKGPCGAAIRTGKPGINCDSAASGSYGPYQAQVLARGYKSSIALPLIYGGAMLGVLNICAGQPDAFSESEVRLLEDLASDLAFGLVFLRNARARNRARQELEEKNAELVLANQGLLATHQELKAADEELRRQLQKLEDSRDRLRKGTKFSVALLHNSPVYFAAVDPELRIIMMNPALLKALDYAENEVNGKPCLELLTRPEERQSAAVAFREIFTSGQKAVNIARVPKKDGQELIVEWHDVPVPDAAGTVEYFFRMGADITESKTAEEQMKKQLAELQRWQSVVLGREDRVADLKREVNDLLTKLGQSAKYGEG